MRDRRPRRKITALKLVRFIGYERDALHAFGAHRVCDRVYGYRAVYRLTAGHCYSVVVKNLEGDVGVRRDGLANRE